MKRALAFVAIILLAGCTAPIQPVPDTTTTTTTPTDTVSSTATPTTTQGTTVTVERVVDGDTLEVSYADGTTETVRLLGVDTPEVHTTVDPAEFEGIPDSLAGRAWLRDWGDNASAAVKSRVANRSVEIVVGGDRRGSYGRLLVFVYAGDAMLNRELLREGYARLYDSDFRYRDEFAAIERQARERGVGLWGFEASTAPLQVAIIHADAAGNDRENLNDEYVVLENAGDQALDLSGWQVSDEADKTYIVPDGVVLGPGERVTLYTGSGTDGDGALYWGRTSPVWNNAGDAVLVTTEEGMVAAGETY